jgi:hypothetical protein
MKTRRDPPVPLTIADLQALRAEVQQCAFLHWPAVSVRWGITVGAAVALAGAAAAQRHEYRKRSVSVSDSGSVSESVTP